MHRAGNSMLKVGIIGGAFAGTLHAEGWLNTKKATIVAMSSQSERTRADFVGRFGGKSYQDPLEMIENEDLDVISLTLPNKFHHPLAIKALNKKIHVVCEKPLSMNLQQAKEMIEAAKANNVQLFYAEQIVFSARYKKVKELLDQGAFGSLLHVSHRERHGGPHANWFFDPTLSGGGVTLDMGIHGIGILQWLLRPAKVTHVYARINSIKPEYELDDHCLITMEFDNGVLATVDASWAAPGGVDDVLEVLGRDGYVRADLARGAAIDVYSLTGVGYATEKVEIEKGWLKVSHEEAQTWGWYAEIEHFAKCILENQTSEMSGEDGLAALKVAIAAYESAATNKRIKVDEAKAVEFPAELWLKRNLT
ncbi:MAG: Gfo/Idh/MocA family protein [Candidatus Nanopelagicales bacterium]